MLFNLNSTPSSINIAEDVRNAKVTTAVTATSTVTVLLASNAARAAISVFNSGTVDVFIREGAAVTSALYEVKIPPQHWYKEEYSGARYTGVISCITATGSSALMVSEGTLG